MPLSSSSDSRESIKLPHPLLDGGPRSGIIRPKVSDQNPFEPIYHPSIKMRFNLFLSLMLATLSLARPDRLGGLFRRDLCTDNDEVDCEQSCMPAGSVCCNDGSSTYCDPGTTCIPGGCCPVGQQCSGPGGTETFLLTGTGALPTGGAVATTAGNGGQSNIFTVAPLDTSTNLAGGSTPKTSSTKSAAGGSTATHTAVSGGSTAATQASGGAPGQSRGSELYAIVVIAVGQFLLM